MTTPVTLPTGESLEFGLYPNRNFHRGEPLGQRGHVLLEGRRLQAVRSDDGRVWCPAGSSGDWFALLSRTSQAAFVAGR